MTRSEQAAADVVALLRARNPIIWVTTAEEARVERHLIEAAAAAARVPHFWDAGQGCTSMDGRVENFGGADPGAVLAEIAGRAGSGDERGLWILRDLPVWMGGGLLGAAVLRQVRNLARMLPGVPRERSQAIVVLTPTSDVPPELAGHVSMLEWPLPDRAEIGAILNAAVETLPDEELKATAVANGQRDAAIDAAVGLMGEEASACYARSLVQLRRIDPTLVAREKKRVIARERVLEWIDPVPGGLDAVGGLDNLKKWLVARAAAFGPRARAYGLPAPRGVLLAGPPGTGKSLCAKAVATAWGVPLLRLDLGSLKSKFVGESEANLRKALKVIEAIGRAIIWIDEIEKALQGATSGSVDGGVSADALGAVLSWMQERQGEAFVVATCNDVEALPPELLRKGRFDELWFVDLPNTSERADILATALRAHGRSDIDIDRAAVVAVCDGFTGAEIAALVPDALFAAFADDVREINTADLIKAARDVVPLSKTAAEKIERLRAWAKGRARFATSSVTEIAYPKRTRALDL
jgi:hypothetical protein